MRNIEDLKPIVWALRGKVKDVWNIYHGGLLEGVYQDAISIELKQMGVVNETEVDIPMWHKGVKMKHQYRADMVIFDDILVEFKACKELINEHRAQLFNYMRLTKKPIGVLINFSPTQYTIERYVLGEDNHSIEPFK